MVAASQRQMIFNEIPTGYPEPGKTTKTVFGGEVDLDASLNGGILIKTLFLSIDPDMRSRMRESHIESYAPAFHLGKP
jgi:NADPH-dependent curcumin reductase CurA